MYHKSLQIYKTKSVETDMSVADPHRIIQMMMQGVLENLVRYRCC